MDFVAPVCNYCQQMYSKIREPIFIICLCEKVAKYAHGSCFRKHLVDYDYGVCDSCFAKTRMVADGYKSFSEVRIKGPVLSMRIFYKY